MHRSLAVAVVLCFALATAAAQIPGVRVDLFPRSLVTANGTVEVRMVIRTDLDAVVPADLINGVQLLVTVDDQKGRRCAGRARGSRSRCWPTRASTGCCRSRRRTS